MEDERKGVKESSKVQICKGTGWENSKTFCKEVHESIVTSTCSKTSIVLEHLKERKKKRELTGTTSIVGQQCLE